MHGLHLTADLAGCPAALPAMSQPESLRTLCLQAVAASGLTAVGERFHGFPSEAGEPRGVTGVVLLAESHLAIHTWPEIGRVTVDVFVCHRRVDNSGAARAPMAALVEAFEPERVERNELVRGASLEPSLAQ